MRVPWTTRVAFALQNPDNEVWLSAEEPAERDADAERERDPPSSHPATPRGGLHIVIVRLWLCAASEQRVLRLQHHHPPPVRRQRHRAAHQQRREVAVAGARGRQLLLRLPRARLRQTQRAQQALVAPAADDAGLLVRPRRAP
jgi:hypothetical protein